MIQLGKSLELCLTHGSHTVVLVAILRMRSYWQSLGGIIQQETVEGEKHTGR